MDNQQPDFTNEYSQQVDQSDPTRHYQGVFDADFIFQFKKFRENENYKAILMKEEDEDAQGNKGIYLMKKDFQLCLIYSFKSEKEILEVLTKIPHYNASFNIFIVSFFSN